MYAVIRSGGKQYRVSVGDIVEVEHLTSKGKQVSFTPILVVTDDGKSIYGKKDLKTYSIKAKILGDSKSDKVDVFKFKSKSGYTARTGHRQKLSSIEIVSIDSKTTKPAAKAPEPESKGGQAKQVAEASSDA